MNKLIERVEATQKTIDEYAGKDFEWGSADCAHLVDFHLANFGIETQLKDARDYSTELGARRAMKLLGCDTMEEFIDALGFERIAPASAIAGDIVGLPGGTEEHEWTALGVHAGGDKVLAFAAPEGATAVGFLGSAIVCTVAWSIG